MIFISWKEKYYTALIAGQPQALQPDSNFLSPAYCVATRVVRLERGNNYVHSTGIYTDSTGIYTASACDISVDNQMPKNPKLGGGMQ
jgi:hypothetical protein